MIDISNKIETLRSAVAESRVIAKKETIQRVVRGDTPKGDVLNVARAAAVLAVKKTPELIPYCHPLMIDAVAVQFDVQETQIVIRVEAKCVGKTGVEMEALAGAMVAALNIYDMTKGIDKDVVIGESKLLEKHGGKSDFQETFLKPLLTAVLVSSDSVSQGKKSDNSGKIIQETLKKFPLDVAHYEIVPDEKKKIQEKIVQWVDSGVRLVVTTGGTGLGPRDVTVEAVKEIIDREVTGAAEAMRAFGQRRTPYAMLSRSIVGIKNQSLIITLPGSSNGVKEGLAALFPNILHAFNMMGGGGH